MKKRWSELIFLTFFLLIFSLIAVRGYTAERETTKTDSVPAVSKASAVETQAKTLAAETAARTLQSESVAETPEDTNYIVGFKERQGILPSLEVKPIESTLTIAGQKTINASYALRHYFYDKDRNVPEGFSLDQSLNVSLKGQIGPKISVNVQWNDKQRPGQLSRPTQNISVVYTGDQNEFIKKAQFGTSVRLDLPRTRYVIYNKTLTGIKVEGSYADPVFGKFNITGIGSITKGLSGTKIWKGKDFISNANIEKQDYMMIRYRFYTLGTSDFDIRSLRVFVDNKNSSDDLTVAIKATAKNADGQDTYANGYFTEYYQGKDYNIFDLSKGIIEFKTAINSNYVIAVAYKTKDGKLIGYKSDGSLDTGNLLLIKDELNSRYYDKYEILNIYDLGHRDIRRDNFKVEIKNLQAAADQDNTVAGDGRPYIQVFGIDRDSNGIVDDNDGVIDFERGLLIFPDTRPFAKYHPEIYEKDTNFETQMFVINVLYEYKSKFIQSVDFDIVENSEKVYVDGKLLKKDIDYYIDYEFGQITFFNEELIKPESVIRVDYEKYPFGIGGQESVLGLNLRHELSQDFNWGLTYMYSGGAKPIDDAPKINSTPENVQIFDVNFKASPIKMINRGLNYVPFLNRLTLPDTYIKMDLSGELAYSLRNPNTFGLALLDDMEAGESTISVSNYYQTWFWGSAPIDTGARGFVALAREQNFAHEQRPDEIIDSMKIEYKYLYSPGDWVSLIHLMSVYGENLEDYNTLKLWFYADPNSVGNVMYIDIGELSEDADGDLELDSEDKDRNRSLGIDEDKGVEFNGKFTWTSGPVIYGKGDNILEDEDLDNDGSIANDAADKFRLRYKVNIEKAGWNNVVIKLDSDTNWYNGGEYLKNIKYVRLWIERMSGASAGTLYLESMDFSKVNWYSTDDTVAKISVVTTQDDAIYKNNSIEEKGSTEIKDIFKQLHPRASETFQQQNVKEGALQVELNVSGDTQPGSVSIYKNLPRGKEVKQLRFYKSLKFFVYHFNKVDSGYLILKLGKTSKDFVGFKVNLASVPVRQWQLYSFDVQDLISVLAQKYDTSIYNSTTGFDFESDSYIVKGKPDIYYINRVMIDFSWDTGADLSDTVWVNDIFTDNAEYRKGVAYTISSGLQLFKFLKLNGNLSFKDSNFKVLGEVLLPGQAHTTTQNAGLSAQLSLLKFMPINMNYSFAKTTTDPEDRQNVLIESTGTRITRNYSAATTLKLPRYLPGLSISYKRTEGILDLYNDTYSYIQQQITASTKYGLSIPLPGFKLLVPFWERTGINLSYNYNLGYSELDYGAYENASHPNRFDLTQNHGIDLTTKLNFLKYFSLTGIKYNWSQSFKKQSGSRFFEMDKSKSVLQNITEQIIGWDSQKSAKANLENIYERIRSAVKTQKQSAGTNFSVRFIKGVYPSLGVNGSFTENFHLLSDNSRGKDILSMINSTANLRITPGVWWKFLGFIKYIQMKYALKLKADYKNVDAALSLKEVWQNFYRAEFANPFGYKLEPAQETELNKSRQNANKNLSLSIGSGYKIGRIADFSTNYSKGVNIVSQTINLPSVSRNMSLSQTMNLNLVNLWPFLKNVYRTTNWNIKANYKSTYTENSKQENRSLSLSHTWPMAFVNKFNLTLRTSYSTNWSLDYKDSTPIELSRNTNLSFGTSTNFNFPLPRDIKLPLINRMLMKNSNIATTLSLNGKLSRSYERGELRSDNLNLALGSGVNFNVSKTVKSGLNLTSAYNRDRKDKKNDYIEFKLGVNFAITF